MTRKNRAIGLRNKGVRVLIVLVLVCLSSFLCVAQSGPAQKERKRADKLYEDYDYALALEAYQKVLQKGTPSLEVVERIANCYRLMNQPQEAAFWYKQVLVFPEAAPVNLFYYAQASRQNQDYVTAKQNYLRYAELEPARREEALKLAQGCDWAREWVRRPLPVQVVPDSALSSSFADFSPVFYQQGLVFSSDRGRKGDKTYGWTGNPFLQLYYAPRENNQWQKPELLGKTINTQYHNATATFSQDYQEVLFTRTRRIKTKFLPSGSLANGEAGWQKYSKKDNHINRLEIYTAQFKNGKWQEAKPFAYNNAREYSVGHPALSPDGQVLYFASDMPGGFGQTDIYFCERQADGTWSQPQNAGAGINTAGKEVFPILDDEGKLFFSSDGHVGMGGLDIFSAEGSKDTWGNVQNLLYPYNSSKDDFGLIFEKDGKNGFLSSNRDEALGSDDIFRFQPNYIPCKLLGNTFVRMRGKNGRMQVVPLSEVELTVFVNGTDSAATFQVHSDAKGEFRFQIKANGSYFIRGTKKGYLTQTIELTPDCRFETDTVSIEMVMTRDTPEQPISLENIYYDLDKYSLRPEAIKELDKVVEMLQDNPSIRIELSSHTDSRNTHHYNQMLSQMRANTAVMYIISKGIAPNRIVAKGYGETMLLNRCKDGVSCSEQEHQLNRRTEFKILRK